MNSLPTKKLTIRTPIKATERERIAYNLDKIVTKTDANLEQLSNDMANMKNKFSSISWELETYLADTRAMLADSTYQGEILSSKSLVDTKVNRLNEVKINGSRIN